MLDADAALQQIAGYEARLEPARQRMASSRFVREILAADADPDLIEAFLINYCAVGVSITEPVEGWILRAGQRCLEIGVEELGRALSMHAKHEANHHLLMIEDTRALVAQRKQGQRTIVEPEALLARPATAGARRYIELHERVIAGPAPYGQIAIEYEIERLSASYGSALIAQCARKLGQEAVQALSFIAEHAELDVGHTHFNAIQLGRLLHVRPDFLDALVAAGSEALDAYLQIAEDCLDLARPFARVA